MKLRIKEAFDNFQVVGYSPYFEQDITFEDFYLTVTNEAALYKRAIEPTIKNLARKMNANKYDSTLALKAWQNVADECVKWYDKKYGSRKGSLTFMSKSLRTEVAKRLMDEYTEDVEYEVKNKK